jgi:hypothetical protein
MMPQEQSPEAPPPQETVEAPPPQPRWYHKAAAVLLVAFCIEVGFFLLIFPWTDHWDTNYFSNILPTLQPYWDNLYFRGAISGIGVVNLYIALLELFRLRRFARN